MMSFWSLRPKVFLGWGCGTSKNLNAQRYGAASSQKEKEKEQWELGWREEDTSGL